MDDRMNSISFSTGIAVCANALQHKRSARPIGPGELARQTIFCQYVYMAKITADQIREHVRTHYVEPARNSHQGQFPVRCGTVEKELGMSNRINHICAALKSRKFFEPNGLRLVETSGPPSGMGNRVVYTYEFLESAPNAAKSQPSVGVSIYAKLRQMEGIFKDVYKELGGADRAIRDEREGYTR
jgi:hypothetical protein